MTRDADDVQRADHRAGGVIVVLRGFSRAAGVIMRQQNGMRVIAQRGFDHLSGINLHLIDGALVQQRGPKHASALIHADHIHALFVQAEKQRARISSRFRQIGDDGFAAHRAVLIITEQLRHQAQQHGGVFAHAVHPLQLRRRGFQHRAQRAETLDQPMGQRVHVPLGNGKHEQKFEHFMLGEAGKPLLHESLLHPRAMARVDCLFAHAFLLGALPQTPPET